MSEKVAIIKRINRDHLEKLRRFNSASEKDKQKLAFDRNFWNAHDCSRYLYDGHCLECGAIVHVMAKYPGVVVRYFPRRAGVSPSPAVRDVLS